MPGLLRTRARRVLAAVITVAALATAAISLWPRGHDDQTPPILEAIEVPAGPGAAGSVTLDAALYLPEVTPAPAVIVAHGFGGSRSTVAEDARRLAGEGFVVLAYSARGFGASTGSIALDSLDYEVADARALVHWLANRPEVLLDGPDDPRIGVTGGSYGGALALMLAGTDHRIDAVAAVATWNDLGQALFPNNITDPSRGPSQILSPADVPGADDGVFKQGWASALLSSILAMPADRSASSGPLGAEAPPSAPGCGRLMPNLCAAYIQVAQTGRITPELSALLARSSPAAVADRITAPTLLVQGEADTLFGLEQADATARAIASGGTPVAVTWYPGGHNGAQPGPATIDRIDGWLRHYLLGTGPVPSTAFRYSVPGPVAQRGQVRTRTLQVGAYPGVGATATRTQQIRLDGAAQVVMNPPGGQPAAITSLPGVSSGLSALGALGALPGQTAVFTSESLESALVVTGSIPVSLSVSRLAADDGGATPPEPSAILYLSLTSMGPDDTGNAAAQATGSTAASPDEGSSVSGGNASAIIAGMRSAPAGGAVAPIRIPSLPADGSAVTVTVNLPAVAYQIPAGSRLAVRVSTTDQGFFGQNTPAAYRITVADPVALVPAVDGTRAPDDDSGQPVGITIGLGLLILVGAAGLFAAGRTRKRATRPGLRPRSEPGTEPGSDPGSDPGSTAPTDTRTEPDSGTPIDSRPSDGSAPAPLVIRGLAKRYPGGVTAVNDVTFTVHRGQVLGLLGPNGAGKTTTLRMVMGLIAPSAGEIEIFGEPARPGAPVLSRIGSFVEGAGFLPHLSGLANLELYWRTTGRPAADAHLEEALAIADLGTAVRRKVKTYSQGMRQRLAIAQAMVGLPDLLLLDEPTNGLDPPQIHAMREVLRRYAATGRTVLVSSHLLSEVEQTCTHVVVMSKGRTIAAGTVAELVATSGEIAIGTARGEEAAATLRGLPGIGTVESVSSGVQADLGGLTMDDALRALLAAGIPITSAAPRNRLEDVFLDLVGSGPAGGDSSEKGST